MALYKYMMLHCDVASNMMLHCDVAGNNYDVANDVAGNMMLHCDVAISML